MVHATRGERISAAPLSAQWRDEKAAGEGVFFFYMNLLDMAKVGDPRYVYMYLTLQGICYMDFVGENLIVAGTFYCREMYEAPGYYQSRAINHMSRRYYWNIEILLAVCVSAPVVVW